MRSNCIKVSVTGASRAHNRAPNIAQKKRRDGEEFLDCAVRRVRPAREHPDAEGAQEQTRKKKSARNAWSRKTIRDAKGAGKASEEGGVEPPSVQIRQIARSDGASAPYQVKDEHNNGDDQDKVDKSGRYVKRQKAQEPQDEENRRNRC